jgi:membrane protease YdiL (CAAX protease family)
MATKVAAPLPIGRRPIISRSGTSAPQFAPAAWRFLRVLIIFGLAYATFELVSDWAWYPLIALNQHAPIRTWLSLPWATTIAETERAAATVGVVMVLRRLLPAPSPVSFGFVVPTRRQLWIGAGFLAVSIVADYIVTSIMNPPPAAQISGAAAFIARHRGLSDYLADLVGTCVATPIVEETMFRGLLFAGLVQWVPAWLAAIVSALIFSMWHSEPFRLVILGAMGVGLALAYYRTGSLWVPIAMHATNNWLAVSASYLSSLT